MTAATFRLPGPLAIAVAQVDAMSGGRVELGIGAGWYDAEHTAYGIPFPPLGERFERLEEQLAVITGLWATPEGARYDFEGAHYTLVDSPALPKPVQRPGPPIIIGGWGRGARPALAATYAAEFNLGFASPEETGAPVRPGARRLPGRRPRPGDPRATRWPRWCAAGATTPRSPAGPPPSAARSTSCASTACAAPRTRWWPSSSGSPRSAPAADLPPGARPADLDHLALLGAEVLPRGRRAI